MPPSITFTTVSSQRASTPLSAQSNQRRGTHVRSGLRYSHVRTERTSEEQEIRTSEALRHSSCWLLLWGWWTDGTITLRRCVVRSPVNFFFLSFARSFAAFAVESNFRFAVVPSLFVGSSVVVGLSLLARMGALLRFLTPS